MTKTTLPFLILALTATVAAGPWGCTCGSDPEKAATERTKIRHQVERSIALVPYRALKVAARAAGAENRPKELQKVVEAMPGPEAMPEKLDSPDAARKVAGTAVDVAVLLYENRAELAKLEEDRFPLLWESWVKRPLPVSWYGGDAEHLALAAAWVVGELVDQSRQTPVMDFAFYELSRAEPQAAWPLPVTLIARLARGASYSAGDYHFAAEEELTTYLALADGASPEQAASLQVPGLDVPVIEVARAVGRFARALNRIGLGRERAAVDDVEQGLSALKKAGVENELTWWGSAFVNYARGKHDEAAKDLEKLASSPYLDETARKEIREAAQNLKKQKPGIFGSARAASIIGGALLARGGGGDKILVRLLGEENAKRVSQPMAWLDRMRESVSKYATPDAISSALREKTREGAGKGLDLLKRKADELRGAATAADAGVAPR